MHAPSRIGLGILAFSVLLGLAAPGVAQVTVVGGPMPVSEAVQRDQYVMTGRLEFRENRYVLLDDSGQLEAYLVPRKSVDLSRLTGQVVDATVREPLLRLGNEPRLWVDKVAAANSEEQPRSLQFLFDAPKPGGVTLAQYSEPIITDGLPMAPIAMSDVSVTTACGPKGWIWGSVEYLWWMQDGMSLPPLVTTSPLGTPRDQAGVLGEPGTAVLYGNGDVLDDGQSGLRLRAGFWFDHDNQFGIEGEILGFDSFKDSFQGAGDARVHPILARPFFNVNPRNPFSGAFDPPAREDSELIAYPGLFRGAVNVDAGSDFRSAGLVFRSLLACESFCVDGASGYSRVDLLAGYRYLRLKEHLSIANSVDSLQPEFPVSFFIFDQFDTKNEFNGIDLGVDWQAGWGRWSVDMLLKTALGNVRQDVSVLGGTTIVRSTPPPIPHVGGMLALPSNIGSYSRDRLALVPELGANLRFAILRRLHATIGYSLVYWGSVVRPGDQIDLDINPDQLPPPIVPMTGAARPSFAFQETDYWVHGVSIGLEGRW